MPDITPDLTLAPIGLDAPLALLAIVLAAIIQDDLTCLAVGAAIAGGEADPIPSGLACVLGTWLGDMIWFGLAQVLGKRLLAVWPFRLAISEDQLEEISNRYGTLGPKALVISRFLPLVRTPLQVATGLMASRIAPGGIVLMGAGLVYVSALVGAAVSIGQLADVRAIYQRFGEWPLVAIPVALWIVFGLVRRLVQAGHRRAAN